MGKIPDRWEEYKPIGECIPGTRFIAFKVPLHEGICMNLRDRSEWFTIQDLIEGMKEKGVELGLVIDLTNTSRYYRNRDVLSHNIEYQKIFTEGHVVPSKQVQQKFQILGLKGLYRIHRNRQISVLSPSFSVAVDNFFDIVDDFLARNEENDKLIGVHCTHGLNRTGYLVCRYMIDRLLFDPQEAINAFNTARGHDMERENYLDDLLGKTPTSSPVKSSYKSPANRQHTGQAFPHDANSGPSQQGSDSLNWRDRSPAGNPRNRRNKYRHRNDYHDDNNYHNHGANDYSSHHGSYNNGASNAQQGQHFPPGGFNGGNYDNGFSQNCGNPNSMPWEVNNWYQNPNHARSNQAQSFGNLMPWEVQNWYKSPTKNVSNDSSHAVSSRNRPGNFRQGNTQVGSQGNTQVGNGEGCEPYTRNNGEGYSQEFKDTRPAGRGRGPKGPRDAGWGSKGQRDSGWVSRVPRNSGWGNSNSNQEGSYGQFGRRHY